MSTVSQEEEDASDAGAGRNLFEPCSAFVFFARQAGAATVTYIGNKIIHRRDQQDQRDDQRDDSGHIHLEI